MTKKDKIIAVFLVSMGVFSSAQASQYVSALSSKDKEAISAVAKASLDGVTMCAAAISTMPGSDEPTPADKDSVK